METVNVHEAKTHFSKLVAKVEQGETIIIAKAGKPIGHFGPIPATEKPDASRRLGFLRGQIHVPDNWKEIDREEIEKMFYGEE